MQVIQELNGGQLEAWMQPSEETRLIEFYASWCIYHLLTKRKLESLANHFSEVTRIGRIDCLDNERLFESFGIDQIPTIGFFRGETRLLWIGDTDLECMLTEIEQAASREHAR